jgi:hypothetical protein
MSTGKGETKPEKRSFLPLTHTASQVWNASRPAERISNASAADREAQARCGIRFTHARTGRRFWNPIKT